MLFRSFGASVPAFDKALEAEVVRNGWFREKPSKAIGRWSVRGVIAIVLGVVAFVGGLNLPSNGLLFIGVALVIGEIGIGNTTVAAALSAALLGGEPATWVVRGTGVDDAGLARKRAAVTQATERVRAISDPIDIMREAGGTELTAMAAATLAARLRSIPVVLDGYVVTADELPLHVADPAALDHCIVGHCSAEPGHRRLLERLGKRPLLDLDMRLGEGSGAMAAVPLVAMACAGITEVPTFAEWFGEQ